MSETAMPEGSHVATLSGHLAYMNLPYDVTVVWLDRDTECEWCGQYVSANPGCPVTVDTGAGSWAEVQEWDKKHGCGNWLTVKWSEVKDGEDPAEVARALMA